MITSSVDSVSPAIAKEWLKRNTGNFRKKDKSRVTRYAREMKTGNWHLNGESIKFDENGILIDGQHRLEACVESGTDFQTVVVRNVPPESAQSVDRGKPRTVAQWLQHQGIKNGIDVASIARNCVAHEKGLWATRAWGAGLITDSEVIDFANEHQHVITECRNGSRLSGMPISLLGTILFIGSGKRDPNTSETAKWFREALCNGIGLNSDDAVLHLRNRIIKTHYTKSGEDEGHGKVSPNSAKVSTWMLRWIATLAWNKTVKGEACGPMALRIRLTGPTPTKPPSTILVADQ